MDSSELERLTHGREMNSASATEVVNWAAETFKEDLLLACGFSADDTVLLDMLMRIGARPKVAIIDSGRLLPETYEFMDEVIDRYRISPSFYLPDTQKLQSYLLANGPNAFRNDHGLRLGCCEIRRHEPLKRALEGGRVWMAGLRRSQSDARQATCKVAMDPVHDGIVKICPLADWSWEQVWAYAKEHSVPTHPLYDRGYMSIGCAPCTRSSSSGDERAGRWWWEPPEQREDGVHVVF